MIEREGKENRLFSFHLFHLLALPPSLLDPLTRELCVCGRVEEGHWNKETSQ